MSDVMRTASRTVPSASPSLLVDAARCGLGSILRANSPAWCAGNLLLLPSSHCIRSRSSMGCVQLLDFHWRGLGPLRGMRCCDPRLEYVGQSTVFPSATDTHIGQPWCLKKVENVECQKTLRGEEAALKGLFRFSREPSRGMEARAHKGGGV